MKMVLNIVGIVAVLSGVVGFFGDNSVLGIYNANTAQNIVHIILGLVLLMSAMKGQAMLTKIVGIVFAIVGILGFVMQGDTVLSIAVDSTATNSLHLVLGIVVLLIAFMNKGGSGHASMGGGMNNQQMPPQNPQM
jgi:predicted anti-sigma-YlaC factor YlaD